MSLYQIQKKQDYCLITLTLDSITMYENEEIKKSVISILDEGNKNIILDLSNTNFISTIVIASFVFMLKRAKEAGGDLLLCNVKDKVREVLLITNLDKVFEILPDLQSAISKLTRKS